MLNLAEAPIDSISDFVSYHEIFFLARVSFLRYFSIRRFAVNSVACFRKHDSAWRIFFSFDRILILLCVGDTMYCICGIVDVVYQRNYFDWCASLFGHRIRFINVPSNVYAIIPRV